ncbi:MAG: transporter [Verrucomicrobia bacterium]|nr:transporter [Verrucomicrobiota bacterium]
METTPNRLTKALAIAAIFTLGADAFAAPKKPAPESSGVQRMPTVTSLAGSILEEQPVDETGRPEWTSARRFTGTRVYIQKAPWEFGIESWWRIKHKRDGTLRHRLLQEVEIGLPGRLQLDLYTDHEGDNTGAFHFHSFNVELRYALAEWGKIWGNPTIYAEYKFADHHWGPDVYEFKLLFGDQLAPRWHWGLNFVWEAELGGDREQEFQVTGGLSYTVIDGKLGVGVEAFYDRDSVKGARGSAVDIFAVGPSIQWRVTKNIHVDLNCMFGTNKQSERQIAYLIVGYDFGPGESKKKSYTPISGQRN